MKPPTHSTQYHQKKMIRSGIRKDLTMHNVVVPQAFELQNEFAPPAFRAIWKAIGPNRDDAEEEKRRRKR